MSQIWDERYLLYLYDIFWKNPRKALTTFSRPYTLCYIIHCSLSCRPAPTDVGWFTQAGISLYGFLREFEYYFKF